MTGNIRGTYQNSIINHIQFDNFRVGEVGSYFRYCNIIMAIQGYNSIISPRVIFLGEVVRSSYYMLGGFGNWIRGLPQEFYLGIDNIGLRRISNYHKVEISWNGLVDGSEI